MPGTPFSCPLVPCRLSARQPTGHTDEDTCAKHRDTARTAASKLVQQHTGVSGSQARWPARMPCTMHVWRLAPTAPMQPCAAKPRASKRPAQGGTRPRKPCRSQHPSQKKISAARTTCQSSCICPTSRPNEILHSLSIQTGPPSKGFAESQQAPAEQQTTTNRLARRQEAAPTLPLVLD